MNDSFRASDYQTALLEANLSNSQRNHRNAGRFLRALQEMEIAGEGYSCACCGAKTYKDSAVLIRPGEWARPRDFHKDGCPLDKLMRKAHKEIAEEETKVEEIWNATEGRRIARNTIDMLRKKNAK